jgi:hypothetical protein
MHAEPFGTPRHPVAIATVERVAMLIEGDGGDASPKGADLIGIPGIEGRIGGDMQGKELQQCDRL